MTARTVPVLASLLLGCTARTSPPDAGGPDATDPYGGWDAGALHVDAVDPTPLVPGEAATLSGAGFLPDPTRVTVRFGSEYPHPSTVSPTKINVTVPPALPAGHVAVQVMISTFRSNQLDAVVSVGAQPDGGVAEAGTSGPQLYTLDPNSGAAYAVVRLWASGLQGSGLHVFFGTTEAAATLPSGTYVDVKVPSGLQPGTVDVYFTVGGTPSNHLPFTAR